MKIITSHPQVSTFVVGEISPGGKITVSFPPKYIENKREMKRKGEGKWLGEKEKKLRREGNITKRKMKKKEDRK